MKKSLISAALVYAGLMFGTAAYADCNLSRNFKTVDISMDVGRVVVQPSDPVGQILKTAQFTITPNGSSASCNGWGDYITAELSQNYAQNPAGKNVYATNIPGIGIRLYRKGDNAAEFSGYYPYQNRLSWKNYVLAPGFFYVEIIKTAPSTGSGTLVPGRYSSYYINNGRHLPLLTSTVYGNAITIASSSCEILGDNTRTIQLEPVTRAGFNGIGSSQGQQDFELNIRCNGGYNPTGYDVKSQISVSYNFVQEDGNRQVLKNTAAQPAQGVGTQLLLGDGRNQVIGNGDRVMLGSIGNDEQSSYRIPMTARYVQSGQRVTAGQVRGLATVTIKYD